MRLLGVTAKLLKLVATIGAEAHHQPTPLCQVSAQMHEHLAPRAGRQKRHHVAGAQNCVKTPRDPASLQIQFCQVADGHTRWASAINTGSTSTPTT